jgi:hypothetical protein
MALPTSVAAQMTISQARDSQGVIPNFYKFGNEIKWCVSLENAKKIAKDANELLYYQEDSKLCREMLDVKNQMILNLELAVAEQAKSIDALQRSNAALEGKVNIGNDRVEIVRKQLELKDSTIGKQAVEIKKLSSWYKSPILWFGIGFATSVGVIYFY